METSKPQVATVNMIPYSCEYAKSSRSKCKHCSNFILFDTLRMATKTRSGFFDGFQLNWFHFDCFFEKYLLESIDQIENIDKIRYDDVKRVEEAIKKKNAAVSPLKKKYDEIASSFIVEYAKSNRSKCKFCDQTITKDSVRFGKIDYESEEARRFGPFHRWFHSVCFETCVDELDFHHHIQAVPGFEALEPADKRLLASKKTFKKIKKLKLEFEPQAGPSTKDTVEEISDDMARKLKEQSDRYFANLALVKSCATFANSVLEQNGLTQTYDHGLEILADALTFGLAEPCPKCSGVLHYRNYRYECISLISEWESCDYTTLKPARKPLIFDKKYCRDTKNISKIYKFEPCDRLIDPKMRRIFEEKESKENLVILAKSVKKEDEDDAAQCWLKGFNVSIIGRSNPKLKIQVEKIGGNFVSKIDSSVLFAFCSEENSKKHHLMSMLNAMEFQIPLVNMNILEEPPQRPLNEKILKNVIEPYGLSFSVIESRIEKLDPRRVVKVFKSGASKSGAEGGSALTTGVIKSGGIVDPLSNLDTVAHIFKSGGVAYSAVLNRVDLEQDVNSFYKIQILQSDSNPNSFWFFKSSGRIGSDTPHFDKLRCSKFQAITEFKKVFYKKTANYWGDAFERQRGYYFPLELDFGDDPVQQHDALDAGKSVSTLHESIKHVIELIFNIREMEFTMKQFKIDTEKLPLGKLAKGQLLKALSTLKDIQTMLKRGTGLRASKLKELCSKYYTLVPHNFGLATVPLIRTDEEIQKETEMIECMMEMEIAYEIINQAPKSPDMDPFDSHYGRLNTQLHVLDTGSEEYKMVEKYLFNTHGSTHSMYQFELVNVIKIVRSGEDVRYKPYENADNRQLLWHGSKLTNFAGILSQGLRIAPPEAPHTGFMFGKGVYFADSSSKSANYCAPDALGFHAGLDEGLLLLSEVALGRPLELTAAQTITKLDEGYDSVKGVGLYQPADDAKIVLDDGVIVPLGELRNTSIDNGQLLYNEYIVYDEARIKQRYLVNVIFKTHSLF